jgi:peroxiredoxin
MPLRLEVGDPFPDLTLPDDAGRNVSISEVAQGQPLFLALFRGPW